MTRLLGEPRRLARLALEKARGSGILNSAEYDLAVANFEKENPLVDDTNHDEAVSGSPRIT